MPVNKLEMKIDLYFNSKGEAVSEIRIRDRVVVGVPHHSIGHVVQSLIEEIKEKHR